MFYGCLFSQEDISNLQNRKNELKIDFFNLMLLNKLSITYERILNEDFSIGITGIKTTNKYFEERFENNYNRKALDVQIIPFVRYTLNKIDDNSLMYLEFITAYNSGKHRVLERNTDGLIAYYVIEDKTFQDIAIGGSFGYKQYIFKYVCVDLNIGLAKNLFSKNSQEVIPRVGANIGYRF